MPALPDPSVVTATTPSTEAEASSNADVNANASEPHPDAPFDITVRLPRHAGGTLLTLQTSPGDCVQDLRQAIAERPETFAYSCFYLRLATRRLHDVEDVRDIPGLVAGAALDLVEDLYTEREARIHITRLRDLLSGPVREEVQGLVLDPALSFFSFLSADEAASKGKDVAVTNGNGTDTPIPPHAFSHYDTTDAAPRLSRLLLPLSSSKAALSAGQCLRALGISGWSPPPRPLRLQGHLLYLSLTTLEGDVLQVTSAAQGFHLNSSTQNTFDPSPRKGSAGRIHHSLISLLQTVSPLFATRYAALQASAALRHPLESLPAPLPLAAAPWAVPGTSLSAAVLSRHRHDACRPAERWLLAGIDSGDGATSAYGSPSGMRDWNEELQEHRELPRSTPAERLIRERLLHRLHAEFTAAAIRGAVAVVDGEVPSLNPVEEEPTDVAAADATLGPRMYLHEGIFYSCGYDATGPLAALGGEEAARVATAKDVAGVRLLNNIDPPSLHTIGTLVVDYKGERVVAQTIVPGIFQRQEEAVIYGSADEAGPILANPDFHALLAPVAKALRLSERTLPTYPGQGEEEKKEGEEGGTTTIWTSADVKGLQGTDGRKYLLDLYRSTPLDLPFLKKVSEEETPYPHGLPLLRPELIDLYWETRFQRWAGEKLNLIRKEVEEEFPLPSSSEDKTAEDKTAEDKTTEDKTEEDKTEEDKTEEDKVEEDKATSDILAKRKEVMDARLVKDIDLDKFVLAFNPDATLATASEDCPEWEAGAFLRNTLVPSFAADLISFRATPLDGESLTQAMHTRGINVRYLGALADSIRSRDDARLAFLERLLLREMVVRALKHHLRSLWRSTPLTSIPEVTAAQLNALLHPASAPTDSASLYAALTTAIAARFRFTFPGGATGLAEWISSQLASSPNALLREIARRAGLQLLARDYPLATATTSSSSAPPFAPTDILNILPLHKSSAPKAAMADEVFEHGRIALSQEPTPEDGADPEAASRVGLELIIEALAIYEQTCGFLHPDTTRCYAFLATLLYHLGHREAALDYQRKAVIASERTNGLDHPDTIAYYSNLGFYEQELGDVPRALRYLRHAMDLTALIHGSSPPHPDAVTADSSVAVILQGLHDYPRSTTLFRRALATQTACVGPTEPSTASVHRALARAHALEGDFKAAMAEERAAATILAATVGEADPRTQDSQFWLQKLTASAVRMARRLQAETPAAPAISATSASPPAPAPASKKGRKDKQSSANVPLTGDSPIEDLLKFIESPSKKGSKKRSKQ